MSLESVPEALKNTTNEYCFEACLGMTLAHYKKLGNLGLLDIVAAISQPDEAFTPMARTFEWLHSFGLQVEYIEPEDEDNTEFFSTLREVGATTRSLSPTTDMAIELANKGNALITQMSYIEDQGQDDYDLDHAIFLSQYDDTGLLVLDPNGMQFATSRVESLWGRYPNLISISSK